MRPIAPLRASARSPLLQVLKTSVAAIAAWLLSTLLLQQPLPIFAAIAALLVVQPSVNQSLAKGIERSIGVILGVILAFVAGLLFGSATWVVLAVIVVSLLVAWALKLTPGSSNQIPISAMLVLAIGARTQGAQTPEYSIERILETIIGAVVGLIVNVIIVPPVLVAPARLAVARLAAGVSAALDRLSSSLTSVSSPTDLRNLLEQVRELRPMQRDAIDDLDSAAESLTFNPRAAKHRKTIEQDRKLLERLSTLVTRTIGMTRAVHDNYDAALVSDPIVIAIAKELTRAAHDVRLLSRSVGAAGAGRPESAETEDGEPPLTTTESPALTAPLVIAKPDPEHWILVGSLMEDIRRIREEILDESDDVRPSR